MSLSAAAAVKTPAKLEIEFIYKGTEYHIKGDITRSHVQNTDQLNIVLGSADDPFPCIMLDYIINKRIFNVYKLRANPWKAVEGSARIKCFEPALPAKGALDILVFLSLAIAEKIDPGARVKIKDDARIENNKVLSWLKYFAAKQTAYSKYGFILRERDLSQPPADAAAHFKDYMTKQMPQMLKLRLHEAVDKKTIKLMEKAYKEYSLDSDMKAPKLSPNFTLQRIIGDWIETEYLGEILDIMKKNIHIDLRGIWYLDWEYYHGLRPEDRVQITSWKTSS
jgi:hypothetical protein